MLAPGTARSVLRLLTEGGAVHVGPSQWLDVAQVSDTARMLADFAAERVQSPVVVLGMASLRADGEQAFRDWAQTRWRKDVARQVPGARAADVHSDHQRSEGGLIKTAVVPAHEGLHHGALIADSNLDRPLVFDAMRMGSDDAPAKAFGHVLRALLQFLPACEDVDPKVKAAVQKLPKNVALAEAAVQLDR
eukprot:jgi/Tetstr1/430141/TSEL_019974.t1